MQIFHEAAPSSLCTSRFRLCTRALAQPLGLADALSDLSSL